nr:hypothetical protein [Pandoraea nosoerga]
MAGCRCSSCSWLTTVVENGVSSWLREPSAPDWTDCLRFCGVSRSTVLVTVVALSSACAPAPVPAPALAPAAASAPALPLAPLAVDCARAGAAAKTSHAARASGATVLRGLTASRATRRPFARGVREA